MIFQDYDEQYILVCISFLKRDITNSFIVTWLYYNIFEFILAFIFDIHKYPFLILFLYLFKIYLFMESVYQEPQ